MQRIPSGVIDQYVYFLAMDATDHVTPETGLSSFTVYRSRNGGTATVYTTPTISELSSSNMPGWYRLLVDEDTTIDAGDDSQVMALHITATGMAPARVLVELYRPPVTPGQQLTVSSGSGNAAVQSIANNALTAAAINNDAFTAAKFAADVTTELQAGLATAAALSTVAGYIDTEVAAIKAKTDNLPSDPADASDIAAAFGTVNGTLTTIAGYIDTEVAAIKAKTDNLPSDPADASVVAGLIAAVEAKVDTVDTVVDAIKINSDKLGTAMELDGAVYRYTVNALEQAPSGGGGGGPTAEQIADEVQTRTMAAVTMVNGLDAAAIAAIQSGLATAADLGVIDTKVDELHKLEGLDIGNPMTVTPTSREAGSIQQAISGDGATTSTVTRTA